MQAAAAPAPGAPAVAWQEEAEALRSSSEWQSLLADLAAAPGGPSVAALLRRAAAQAAQPGGAGGGGGGSPSRLAEAVQQASWEKLHSGDWHTVAVAWRDAYAAACILAAAAGLPGRGEEQEEAGEGGGAGAGAAEAAGEAAGLSSALWHLDMAAIMGGPLLRPRIDALIARLQRRWQALHGAAVWQPAGSRQPPGERGAEGGSSSGGEPAAKRPRYGGAEDRAAVAAAAAAAAGDAALLPPGSLGPRGTPVPVAELPSLEAFWRDYMSTGTPVVVTGERASASWRAVVASATNAFAR